MIESHGSLPGRDFGEPVLSIVVPALAEEENIASLHEAVEDALRQEGLSWELIFCDDGSPDQTWRRISELSERDPRVSGVRLSRNFGHQYAIMAGLAIARGRAIITMDADHQHPPKLIPSLVRSWRSGNKIVHTVRTDSASTGVFKRVSSRVFYRVYSFLSGVKIDPGMADYRLLDRKVVNDLLLFREEGLFLRGLVQWVGYDSDRIPFEAADRRAGRTKYTPLRMMRFAWTGITSFSMVPLRLGIFLGLLTSAVAFCGVIYSVWAYFAGRAVPGWASVVAITTYLFGILFILIGLIGDYVGRMLKEVRGRPRYLVSQVVGPAAEGGEFHDAREYTDTS
jgi:dolichol-phosphate mannosyltransferase